MLSLLKTNNCRELSLYKTKENNVKLVMGLCHYLGLPVLDLAENWHIA